MDIEHRQLRGYEQPNILECFVAGLSPGKGRQLGKQGKGEGGTAEGTPNFSATNHLVIHVRPMTLIGQ